MLITVSPSKCNFQKKKNSAIQPPFLSIHHTCQSASCCIYRNGGVIFWQLSCHILENVNECVCKIKFMGCQRRIRTRRAITSLLSSFELWYIKQKTMQLNVGISIVQVLEWMASVFCCLFWLFVLESSEIKMIIIHQSMRAPMKAWKDLPSYIYFCFLRELSFIRTACFLLKLILFGLILWAPSKSQLFCFCIWYIKVHFKI